MPPKAANNANTRNAPSLKPWSLKAQSVVESKKKKKKRSKKRAWQFLRFRFVCHFPKKESCAPQAAVKIDSRAAKFSNPVFSNLTNKQKEKTKQKNQSAANTTPNSSELLSVMERGPATTGAPRHGDSNLLAAFDKLAEKQMDLLSESHKQGSRYHKVLKKLGVCVLIIETHPIMKVCMCTHKALKAHTHTQTCPTQRWTHADWLRERKRAR